MTVTVLRAGFLTTVQDPGRFGHRQSGASTGGALDAHALRIANLLAGNEPSAAGLEATAGNLRLQFEDDRMVAWCGGAFEVKIADTPLAAGRAALIRKGETLRLAAPAKGARAWLALSGGIDVPLVLGSRSTDLRSKFGGFEGRALRDGDVLRLNEPSDDAARIMKKLSASRIAPWSAPAEWAKTTAAHPFLRIVRGTDWNRFNDLTIQRFTSEAFNIMPDSDRMGVRLEGPALMRLDDGDLLSAAVTPGTIQVPPNGQPILLLGDCQTIGGYPKIAHVITVDLPGAAQLQPGDQVRFHAVSLGEAHRLLIERERALARFRVGLAFHTA